MGDVDYDSPPSRGEHVGQALLYAVFGAAVLGGGWFLGSLRRAAEEAPMAAIGAVVWWTAAWLSVPVLIVAFVARPRRAPHRWAWAAAMAVGYYGLFRAWPSPWSVAVGTLSAVVLIVPRRSLWRWASAP